MPKATLHNPLTDEEEVLAHLQQGETDLAVDWLMNHYGNAIYAYCLSRSNTPDQADDLLQKTFLNAHKSLGTFRHRSSLKTWLFGIAHHRCLDAARTRNRQRERFSALDTATEVPGSRGPNFETSVSLRSMLDYCLSKLSSDLRELILLRFAVGFSYLEIEQILESTSVALRRRVSRTLPALRKCLFDQGGEP